jgi:tetratricopeptide (TPR) repeat protein
MSQEPRLLITRVCLLGAAIALSITGILIFTLVQSGWRPFARKAAPVPVSFSQLLREYDGIYGEGAALETLGPLLESLEKKALGIESQLSVLKRRRALVFSGRGALEGSPSHGGRALPSKYRAAAERAAALFPRSELLAAAAAEGAVLEGALNEASAWAENLSEADVLPLSLAVSCLAGDFKDPETALAKARSGEKLILVSEFAVGNLPLSMRNWELFTLDAAVLRILGGNVQGASPLVQVLQADRVNSSRGLRFSAEYHYDFGNLRRAAELFARLGSDWGMAREADALVLAGDWGAARSLWTLLTSPNEEGLYRSGPDILERGLYNLAASSSTRESELVYTERLLRSSPNHLYGLIRYTRLLSSGRAAAILEGAERRDLEPLLDLELLRRQRDLLAVDRIIPGTWLLINRHPGSSALAEWGLWYFDFQKQYAESSRLKRNFAFRSADSGGEGVPVPWLEFSTALELIRAKDYASAETLLQTLEETGGAPWQVPANLGRLLEARRAPAAAQEYYAAAKLRAPRPEDKARLCFRMSRCLRAMGRTGEARAALEEGLALDENSITIRMELSRYNDMGIF